MKNNPMVLDKFQSIGRVHISSYVTDKIELFDNLKMEESIAQKIREKIDGLKNDPSDPLGLQ